jgi:hypothetical protein
MMPLINHLFNLINFKVYLEFQHTHNDIPHIYFFLYLIFFNTIILNHHNYLNE